MLIVNIIQYLKLFRSYFNDIFNNSITVMNLCTYLHLYKWCLFICQAVVGEFSISSSKDNTSCSLVHFCNEVIVVPP